VATKARFEEKVVDHFEEEVKEFTKPTPVILGWEVEFEIENYNYFDLNKPLEIVTEDPPAPEVPKPKLVKPEVKQDPGFWTRPAIEMGFGKTGKQMRAVPDKLSDDSRAGLYPVDLSDGTVGQHLTTKATEQVAAPKEAKPKKVESKDSKEAKPQKATEEPKKELKKEVKTGEVKQDSATGIRGGLNSTFDQFNDFVSGNTPQHVTKGNFYPVNLALLQSKTDTAVGRCLTQEGMFADTCVVDVLRTAVKSSFVDLVETVLDTPEEREDLLKWFVSDQAQKQLEDDEERAERIAKEAKRQAEIQKKKAAEAEALAKQAAEKKEWATKEAEWAASEASNAEQAAQQAAEVAEQASTAQAEAEQHHAAAEQQHDAAEVAAGEFMQISKHGVEAKLFARQHALAPAPGPLPGPPPAGPVLEQSMQGKIEPVRAPGPAPASLDGSVQTKQATGISPAPGPGPAMQWKSDVFVQFYPGEERPVVEDGDVGRSTIVKVWLRGEANTGIFELAPWIQAVLTRHENDGLLEYLLEKRLKDATDIAPTIKGIKDIRLDSKSQWSIDTCASHMKKIMKEFSQAYTRRMVPTAIYNECSNFVSEVSFSHDRIFDSHDRMKCRHATVKLAKEWNFGKGHAPPAIESPGPAPGPAPAPVPSVDYFGFCSEVCEIKYGSDAPMCHVTEGKKLWFAAP
jgi:hypothetical protein